MKTCFLKNFFAVSVSCIGILIATQHAQATIVQFNMEDGSNFQVNLYDNLTPRTVANFLAYVNGTHVDPASTTEPKALAGNYSDTVFHRYAEKTVFEKDTAGNNIEVVKPFIVQGGGFNYVGSGTILKELKTTTAVVNEASYSNVRGTIAMAKVGGNANSATSQWFFNLDNNSENLDGQNGGFTVFGHVIGNGMDVVNQIGTAATTLNFRSPFNEMPMKPSYTQADLNNGVTPLRGQFNIVTSITIVDATVETTTGLTLPPNTIIQALNPRINTGGGGSIGWISLLLLMLNFARRITRR